MSEQQLNAEQKAKLDSMTSCLMELWMDIEIFRFQFNFDWSL